MKRQDKLTKRKESKEWKKIPKPPQRHDEDSDAPGFDSSGDIVPTVKFAELSAELAELEVDVTAFSEATPEERRAILLAAGVTAKEIAEDWRPEIAGAIKANAAQTEARAVKEKRLTRWNQRRNEVHKATPYLRKSLTKAETALVVELAKNPLATSKQLAETVGKSKSWAAERRRDPSIVTTKANLFDAPALPTAEAEPYTQHPPEWYGHGLHGWKLWAQTQIASVENSPHAKRRANIMADFVAEHSSEYQADAVIYAIRDCPAILLKAKGLPVLEALVDLLEAAKWGKSKRRVPCVTRKGERRDVCRDARRILAMLTTHEDRGYDFKPDLLAEIVELARQWVIHLQKHAATTWKGVAVRVQVDNLFDAYREELKDFSVDEVRGILTAKDPLKQAARLAEAATGISAETFEKAYRHPDIIHCSPTDPAPPETGGSIHLVVPRPSTSKTPSK